jgi:hypothetical protein
MDDISRAECSAVRAGACFAPRRAHRTFQPRQACLDARERVVAARRGGRQLGEVAALEEIDEDVGDLPGAQRALGLVPLVEPVAHAEDAEHDQRRRQRAQAAGLDALAHHALDRAVVLALGAGRLGGHRRRQAALLGEEDGEEGEVLGQELDLEAHDPAQRLLGRPALLDDVSQALAKRRDRALDHQREELFLARHVPVERDFGQTGPLGDSVEGGRPVAGLAEGGGGRADDLVQHGGAGRGQRGVS